MESMQCKYYSLCSLLERAGLASKTYVHLPLQNVRSSCCQIQTKKSHLFSSLMGAIHLKEVFLHLTFTFPSKIVCL